ncbi:MAG: hypothetical protein NZ578_07060 [Candidatus Binatia bacterium]|nr:hypothetical protein [Candidatus Binatia bacterium]
MMFHAPPLSGFPNGAPSGMDMTADFAPLFIGMWLIVGLCVLGLAVATAIHDTWWLQRQAKKTAERPAPPPDLPEAA